MLNRAPIKPATSAALLLVLAGCRVGEEIAVAPASPSPDFSGDDAPIVIGDAGASVPSVDAASDFDAGAASSDAGAFVPAADAGVIEDAGAEGSCDGTLCFSPPEGCTPEQLGGHAYLFCAEALTWSEARARCGAAGLDLVIIADAAENAFVASHLAGTSWLGASDQDTEGTWTWVVPGETQHNGAALAFSGWAAATPDNCGGLFGEQDCARISADGSWNDSDCAGGCLETTFAFVCESF
jgi:hypothetical protein